MRLVIRVLGLDLLDIDMTTDAVADEPGECTTYPIGFTAPPAVPLEVEMLGRES